MDKHESSPFDAAALKLRAIAGQVDLLYTTAASGHIEELCEHSLTVCLGSVWESVEEVKELLAQAWASTGKPTTYDSMLRSELEAAHQIIANAQNIMTPKQKTVWHQKNEADGVACEGTTRAKERLALLARTAGIT